MPAVLAVAVCCSTHGAAPAPSHAPMVARWVELLGDNDFQRREEASQRLWEAGQAAESALQTAAASADLEVSRRARDILDRFKWGIYPDTPKKIVELVGRYQSSDRGTGAVIRELFENGTAGCRAVLKIARAEEDPSVRRRLFSQIVNEMPRAVPMLVAEDNFDTLELLVEIALPQEDHAGVGNCVAYWVLRGKVDDGIARFKARTEKDAADRRAAEVLARLYRAKGELRTARVVAERAGRPELVEGILVESGAWRELASRSDGSVPAAEAPRLVERLGFRAAYLRLAGEDKGFDKAVADLRRAAADGADREDVSEQVAKALFLNGRPDDALQVLAGGDKGPMAFEVLAAQMRFRDAFKLLDAERAAKGKRLPELEILAARALWGLGEKDKAQPVFDRYAERIKPGMEDAWGEALVLAELRVGQRDRALQHAATLLSGPKESAAAYRLWPKIFPDKNESAQPWWEYLRKRHPERDPSETLKLIADVVDAKVTARQLKELAEGSDDWLKSLVARPEVAEQWTLALAEAALAARDEGLARATLENCPSAAALQRLGDLSADKKDWQAAAEYYRRAYEADRQKPLPLFLWGRALAMAGQKREGQRRMEQAHWLPLGSEEVRQEFALALSQRRLSDDCRRENDLILRAGEPASYCTGEARRRQAVEERTQKDYLRSADGQQQAMLRCLRAYVSFVQPSANVGVPGLIHRQRMRGYLAAGKTDEAVREASRCLDELPADVDVPILLVPQLVKAGRRGDADAIFGRVNGFLEGIAKDYPRCGWAHNSVAWLCACCRRDLDAALAHARMAVELEPDATGYLDTLAEVLLQRGDKAGAVAAQKKAVELDPKKPYYRKQLQRMEAGDPLAARPPEGEDDDDD
jgi:hypothetical protein